MFSPSDIFVYILLAGSGIVIWIAKRSGSDHRKDASSIPNHESAASSEKMGTHGEAKDYASPDQRKQKATPSNCK